jgi:hypothetical protein
LCCHRRTTGNQDSRDCGKMQVVSIHPQPLFRRLSGKRECT